MLFQCLSRALQVAASSWPLLATPSTSKLPTPHAKPVPWHASLHVRLSTLWRPFAVTPGAARVTFVSISLPARLLGTPSSALLPVYCARRSIAGQRKVGLSRMEGRRGLRVRGWKKAPRRKLQAIKVTERTCPGLLCALVDWAWRRGGPSVGTVQLTRFVLRVEYVGVERSGGSGQRRSGRGKQFHYTRSVERSGGDDTLLGYALPNGVRRRLLGRRLDAREGLKGGRTQKLLNLKATAARSAPNMGQHSTAAVSAARKRRQGVQQQPPSPQARRKTMRGNLGQRPALRCIPTLTQRQASPSGLTPGSAGSGHPWVSTDGRGRPCIPTHLHQHHARCMHHRGPIMAMPISPDVGAHIAQSPS